MSTLEADFHFDFTFPSCDATTPPSFTFDPSVLEVATRTGHSRSSSHGSVYSFESSPSDSFTTCTGRTTPARSPVRTHGPLLLPKIRSQDQDIDACHMSLPVAKRPKASLPAARKVARMYQAARQPSHQRSHTNPETLTYSAAASFASEYTAPLSLLESPFIAPHSDAHLAGRRASSCSLDNINDEGHGFHFNQAPTFMPTQSPTPQPQSQHQTRAQLQTVLPQPESFIYQHQQQSYELDITSPLASANPIDLEAPASTTLLSYLTSPNPAPSLVHSISFPLKDPNTKHFWWDVRQIRPWTRFNATSILTLPGASNLLSCPIPAPLLPTPMTTQRHPETELTLHSIYASYYLPKLNSALQLSSQRPLQFSVPSRNTVSLAGGSSKSLGMATDCMFVADLAGDASSAAALFGGKPTARVVGLVKSFDRFNTGMRVEGNIKRVEYLRGLAHLHHAMREHGCRYGFILTEIELVVVRNGADGTPNFGFLEVASVQLATKDAQDTVAQAPHVTLTACLALWGLCMMAGDEPAPGCAHWRSEIGAPAEATRKKALPRDEWMPQPQLAEKREAKRARGWVWPEDAVGRKELGKRGVRYGAC